MSIAKCMATLKKSHRVSPIENLSSLFVMYKVLSKRIIVRILWSLYSLKKVTTQYPCVMAILTRVKGFQLDGIDGHENHG